jgi:hypothetical protein
MGVRVGVEIGVRPVVSWGEDYVKLGTIIVKNSTVYKWNNLCFTVSKGVAYFTCHM